MDFITLIIAPHRRLGVFHRLTCETNLSRCCLSVRFSFHGMFHLAAEVVNVVELPELSVEARCVAPNCVFT